MFFRRAMTCFAPWLVLLLASTPATAQITNGSFDDGGTGWTTSADPGLSVGFSSTGCSSAPHAQFGSGQQNPGGQACISQSFSCGTPGDDTSCRVNLDYRFNPVSAFNGDTARFLVYLDGGLELTLAATTEWTSADFLVECGQHTIEICFEVDPEDYAWLGCIDDVEALCQGVVVPNDNSSWGAVKALYE